MLISEHFKINSTRLGSSKPSAVNLPSSDPAEDLNTCTGPYIITVLFLRLRYSCTCLLDVGHGVLQLLLCCCLASGEPFLTHGPDPISKPCWFRNTTKPYSSRASSHARSHPLHQHFLLTDKLPPPSDNAPAFVLSVKECKSFGHSGVRGITREEAHSQSSSRSRSIDGGK